MSTIIRGIARLWLYGIVLMLLVGFIQFLAGIPFTVLFLARPHTHPLLAAVILLVYFPIAIAWVFLHILRRRSIRCRATSFLNQASGDPPAILPLKTEADGIMAPLLYLGGFALFNAGLGIGLKRLTDLSQSVFDAALENPEGVPPLTSFVMDIRWWPWIFFAIAILTGILLLVGRVGSRSVLHIIVWLSAVEAMLGLIAFGGYWIPMVSILLRLIG